MEEVLKRQNLHPLDENIIFFEEGHRYEITSDPNSKYTSVTTLIHSHFNKFDSDKIINNMMKGKNWREGHKYWGLNIDEIKKLWSESGKKEAQAGTDLHYNIECFMNNNHLKKGYTHKDLYNYYISRPFPIYHTNIEWQYFLKFILENEYFVPYRTEWMIYDEDYKLAGSVDMVYKNKDGSFDIYDWKRSKEITSINKWNKFSTTPCIAELPDTNFWHYSLQLNIYKRIIEKNYNFIIKDLYLVRLHPNNEDNNYILIKVADLSDEVTRLLEKNT
jgi:ATP-dependent exoDNAse (exonuclease V) beta subunit